MPPRGWNSYDSFSWVVDEAAFLYNAEVVAQRLLPYGYEVRYMSQKPLSYDIKGRKKFHYFLI